MDVGASKILLDQSLMRAAETIGDITPAVYDRYYAGWPRALDSFDELHPGGRQALQGQMVEQVLYCLMEWFDSPGEIEIVLLSTVPHHIDTLKIEPEHFAALIEVVCDVIADTIPADMADERAVLLQIRADLLALFHQGAAYSARALKAAAGGNSNDASP